MAKKKMFSVTSTPVGKAPELPTFAPNPDLPAGQKQSVLKRSAVRVYEVEAENAAEAKSIIEARERDLEAAGLPKFKAGNAKAVKG